MVDTNEHSQGDVDQLLRDFFHAKVPHPWPRPSTPPPLPFVGRPWSRSSRLALAASVLLALAGYVTLASYFPSDPGRSAGQTPKTFGKSLQRVPPSKVPQFQEFKLPR